MEREKLNRNQDLNRKIFVGIVFFLVSVIMFVVIQSQSEREPDQNNLINRSTEYEEEEKNQHALSNTLENRGYYKYRDVPEAMQKLMDSGLLQSSSEETRYQDTKEGVSVKDVELESPKQYLKKMMSANYLRESSEAIVSACEPTYDCKFDMGDLRIEGSTFSMDETTSEVLRQLEEFGFSGITQLFSKAIDIMEQRNERFGEKFSKTAYQQFEITSQGVAFYVSFGFHGGNTISITMETQLNYSMCIAPEKYRGIVESVVEANDYFLYSSCAGAKSDNLTFCKNNAVCELGSDNVFYLSGQSELLSGKRISLMFQDGILDDYYVTITGKEMKLDATDNKFLDTYTKGLGKKLAQEPQRIQPMYDGCWYEIYRTI